jgi:hypothetical protein
MALSTAAVAEVEVGNRLFCEASPECRLGDFSSCCVEYCRAAQEIPSSEHWHMNEATQNLAVRIVRFVDDSFPGWVECQFTDAAGHVHTIVDKYPTFTADMLDAHSQYPRPGQIECQIVSRSLDDRGVELVRIRMPGIEYTEGLSEFVVLPT